MSTERTVYFDNAATTFPKPDCVYDFMDSFYRRSGANAGRGQYKISAESSRIIFETRELVKELLECPNKDVIFTPTATIALNMILQGVIASASLSNRKNCHSELFSESQMLNQVQHDKLITVYISPFEHNAVTRVLHAFESQGCINVKVLPFDISDFSYDLEKVTNAFEAETPDLLILSHVSNVCGFIQPVEDLCRLAKSRSKNCKTILDMAQSAVLVPLNTGSDLFDFAVFAGHKTMLGPLGASGFVMKSGIDLAPVLFGGTGVESANQDMPNDLPARYEMGSLNIHAISGLHAALSWWKNDPDAIRKKESENHARLLSILEKYDFVKTLRPKHSERVLDPRFTGVVSCLFDKYTADEIGSVLDEQNIAVRTGLQCAPLAHKTLGTFPAGTVRFSTGYFTEESDFGELERAMEYLKENL